MSSVRTIVLRADTLTSSGFAPFGALPADEGSEHDDAEAEFLWADAAVNYISHTRDEVGEGEVGLRCSLLNRHDTHTQTLMPVDVDAVVVVAPADVAFDHERDLDAVRAFRVPRGRCIHLWRGTWHWGPYPATAESVRLLNVQGRGYPRDNGVIAFDQRHGAVFEIGFG